MATLQFLLLFVFLITSHLCGIIAIKTFVIKSLEKCAADDPMEGDLLLATVNGEKMLVVDVNVADDINENYKIILNLYHLEDGNWVRTPYDDRPYDITWCEATDVIAKVWALIKAAAEPPLPEGCVVPAGKYSIKGFQLRAEEIAEYLFTFKEGPYKVNGLLKDDDGKSLICVDIEGELKPF